MSLPSTSSIQVEDFRGVVPKVSETREYFECGDEKWLDLFVEVELQRHLKEALARHGNCVPSSLV